MQQIEYAIRKGIEEGFQKWLDRQELAIQAKLAHLRLSPPEPIISLQPVIAVEQPVEPLLEPVIPLQPVITSEQLVTPPSIEKEEKISTSTSSEDLCKLQTRCQSPANLVLAFFVFCTEHVAPSLQFGSPLAYTRYAEDMEATGQG
ncbi:hypothetical protein MMC28_007483 [Mycoblastus sanguinarius]|nr:hypothetical protein [Mycoblastus sanguinarius]